MYPNVEDCVVEVDKIYYVQSYCKLLYNDKHLWVPLLDKLHNDGHKSDHLDHFHIDERFLTDKVFYMLYKYWAPYYYNNYGSNYENSLISVGLHKDNKVSELKLKRKAWKCISEQPRERSSSLNFTDVNLYSKESREKLTLNLNCRICPHKGFDLKNIKAVAGIITCPMHHLKYCENTGKLVNNIKVV